METKGAVMGYRRLADTEAFRDYHRRAKAANEQLTMLDAVLRRLRDARKRDLHR